MHAIVLWGGMCKRLGKTYSVPLRKVDRPILCFVSRAFLHNLVNKAYLVHNFCYYVSFLYMFRATMCPSSGGTTVPVRHLVFVTLCGWLSGLQTSSFLYMFRTTMCPSSEEITVSMRHLVFVTLYGWLSGMHGGCSTLHTRQSSIQSDKYQVSHRYNYFTWWCSHSLPKHVEKRNKHTEKHFAPSWLYLQYYTGTFTAFHIVNTVLINFS